MKCSKDWERLNNRIAKDIPKNNTCKNCGAIIGHKEEYCIYCQPEEKK